MRKRRILKQLERAAASIEWDAYDHVKWYYVSDAKKNPNPQQVELAKAVEKIKEAAEIVKAYHGKTGTKINFSAY
jgi:hypothetical protein